MIMMLREAWHNWAGKVADSPEGAAWRGGGVGALGVGGVEEVWGGAGRVGRVWVSAESEGLHTGWAPDNEPGSESRAAGVGNLEVRVTGNLKPD
jgi:hypothetical protein